MYLEDERAEQEALLPVCGAIPDAVIPECTA
jgi:hypothetical protein